MKKNLESCLIGLLLAAGVSAQAQTVPPGLVDSLKIVGIQKWEIVHTNYLFLKTYPHGGTSVTTYYEQQLPPGTVPTDDSSVYVINMTVVIGNAGDAKVLLRDPQFKVTLIQKDETATAPDAVREIATEVGMARLVADRTQPASWRPIAEAACPEGTNSKAAKETQHKFEIVVKGKDDLERTKQIFSAFNVMNNQSRSWQLQMEGTSIVGWQNRGKSDSTTQVFAHDPVDVLLKSKPTLPDYIAFPK